MDTLSQIMHSTFALKEDVAEPVKTKVKKLKSFTSGNTYINNPDPIKDGPKNTDNPDDTKKIPQIGDKKMSESVNGEKMNSKPRNKHLNDILNSKRNERHKTVKEYDRNEVKRDLKKKLSSKDEE